MFLSKGVFCNFFMKNGSGKKNRLKPLPDYENVCLNEECEGGFTMSKMTKGLLFTVIIVILLVGCSKSNAADDKVTLEFFSVKAENINIYRELIKEFEEKHPNIHVKLEQPPEAETVLRMKLTKNDTPDIIGFNGNPTYGEMAEVGVLHDYSDSHLIEKVDPKYVDMLDRLVGPERDGIYG